jgi:hypothetical protein
MMRMQAAGHRDARSVKDMLWVQDPRKISQVRASPLSQGVALGRVAAGHVVTR